MNEHRRTMAFVAVAVVVSLVAWISRPTFREQTTELLVGKVLFPDFDDPLQATSLEIVEFNESTGDSRTFQVAQVENEWSIPSHSSYPADAEEQLAKVATNLMRLKVLSLETDRPGDHPEFGVADPDKAKVGDTGVGTRVTMRKNKELLLSLVVGKKVPDRDELRYVRETGKDPVYTVELNIDKLSTKFEDWIEEDLLKLNTWDVKRVTINDYSFDALTSALDPRSRMTLEYDDKDSKWKLTEDQTFALEERRWVDVPMAEDEELNTTKLNDMKYALDDLKIVDVARKPAGLSANLKDTGPVTLDARDQESLERRGFHIRQGQLYSSEGEVVILMKDGVQYRLRFGQIAGPSEEAADTAEEEKTEKEGEEEEKEEEEEAGVNRYLFVMAEFNQDVIAKPELEELPGEGKAPEGEAAKTEAAEGNGAAGEESQGESVEAEAADAEKAKPEAPEAEKAKPEAPESETAKDEKAEEAAEQKPAGGASAEETKPDVQKPEDGEPKEDSEDDERDLEKEGERIQKENKRKQEEYDEKVKKGQDRVQELNVRFADWYYVISNDVYRKIHLGREDVVKKKEEEEKDKDEDEGKEEEAGAEQEAAGKESAQDTPDQDEGVKEEPEQGAAAEKPAEKSPSVPESEEVKKEAAPEGEQE